MAESFQSDVSSALSIRLGLQISLSALPVVEEWMDPKLDRWLESVPSPVELPEGALSRFEVAVASDASRLHWSAAGPPAGFVPKLADYLSKCGVAAAQVAIINQIGERFSPGGVGSWVSVREGELKTGWQFVDSLRLAQVVPMLPDLPVLGRLARWAADAGITHAARIAAGLQGSDSATIELDLGRGDQAARLAQSAVSELAKGSLGDAISRYAAADGVRLALDLDGDGVARWQLEAAAEADVASGLCTELGLGYADETLQRVQGAIGARGVSSVRIARRQDAFEVDVVMIPGTGAALPRPN